MPSMNKVKSGARKLQKSIRSIPAPIRRKVGTKILKKAVGAKAAKKTVRVGRTVRRITGIKYV